MITFKIASDDQGTWIINMQVPWQGGSMCPMAMNLDTPELENLQAEIGQALERPSNEPLYVQMVEFIRSIAEYDRYIAYNELPNATDEEQELHAYKFDAEVLRLIETRAKELNQRGT